MHTNSSRITAYCLVLLLATQLLTACVQSDGSLSSTVTSPSAVEGGVDTIAAVDSEYDLQLITNTGKYAFARAALESDLPVAQLTVDDPVYGRPKQYEGVWLTDLLAAVGALDEGGDTVLFRAADGYETRR